MYKLNLKKFLYFLISILLFLIPLQTRFVWHWGKINGGDWEYGTNSIFGTQILLWIIIFLFSIYFYRSGFVKNVFSKINFKKYNKKLLGLLIFAGFGLFFILRNLFFGNFFSDMPLHFVEVMCLVMIILFLKLDFKQITWPIWLSGVVQGILAFGQFITQNIWGSKYLGLAEHTASQAGSAVLEFSGERWLRAYGSFGWPNTLGIFLGVVLVLGIILYLKTDNKKLKLIISSGQLIILSGLILSFSRGAWIAVLSGLIYLLIFNFKNYKIILKNYIYYLLLIFLFIIILLPLFQSRFNLNNRVEFNSISERIGEVEYYKNVLNNNLWWGTGLGAYTYKMYSNFPDLKSWDYNPVHNIYLLFLVEFGLITSLLVLFLIVYYLPKFIKQNPVYFATLLVLIVAGFFDHWSLSSYSGVLFFGVIFVIIKKPRF